MSGAGADDGLLELTVDSLAAGGDAVGRDDGGRVTFVAGAVPGERVRVRLVEVRSTFARADLVEVLGRSAERVEPPCALFRARQCGGCQWQHVSAAEQARAKQAIVASALRHQVERGLTVLPIATPVQPYRWRRRARLHWLRPRGARVAMLGFFAPSSRRLAAVRACPQLEAALEAAVQVLQDRLAPALRGKGEVEVLAGEGGAVHVAVHGAVSDQVLAGLVGQGGIVGASAGTRSVGADRIALEGGLDGRADRFAQAARDGNAGLIAAALAAAGPHAGLSVLELHAGSGNLSRALAGAAAEVVAVERSPGPSVAAGNLRWRVGTAERVVEAMVQRGDRFDVVVLDPPRQGARELMAPLAQLAARRMVYVSCDPATLGRDLAVLVDGGYRAVAAQPLDLMPQTAHVEVVVQLDRIG